MKLFFVIIFNSLALLLSAQFHGPAGSANSIAMHTDSNAFVAWAKECKVTRGYQDISNQNLGLVNVGDSSFAIGKADAGIVSLGDGGNAIVTFSAPIINGPGYDFAVFENAFNDSFLELAFVEVSSDGVNYVRFPSVSNSPLSPQFDNNASMDATKINNLAGKYRALYGTPFDLQELSTSSQLDIDNITHIRIIDVIGNVLPPFANNDSNNNPINDPWPTPFPQGGFDLDAIGVIHQKAVGIIEWTENLQFSIFPNPVKDKVTIQIDNSNQENYLTIKTILGHEVFKQKIESKSVVFDLSQLNSGIYFFTIQSNNSFSTKKIIKE